METVALVTGANRGIGLEVARQLAQAGMHVIVTARDEARAAIAAETLSAEGLPASAMAVDVASADSVRRLAARVESRSARSTCWSTTRPPPESGSRPRPRPT